MDVSCSPQGQTRHLTEHFRACQKGKAWEEHCSEKNPRTWLWASALLVYRGPWICSDICPSSSHLEPICRVTLSPHEPQPTPQWPHLLPCIRKHFPIWYSSCFIFFDGVNFILSSSQYFTWGVKSFTILFIWK